MNGKNKLIKDPALTFTAAAAFIAAALMVAAVFFMPVRGGSFAPTAAPETTLSPETSAPAGEDTSGDISSAVSTAPAGSSDASASADSSDPSASADSSDPLASADSSDASSSDVSSDVTASGVSSDVTASGVSSDVTASAVSSEAPPSSGRSEVTTPKPVLKVGVSPTTYAPGTNVYVGAAKAAGFTAVILPTVSTEERAAEVLSGLDAIILTGGEDLDPAWYGESEISPGINDINAPRDTSDMLYIRKALELDMPMLCICRGMQLLNVACGGTLYQDIPMQVGTSVVHRDPNRRYFVNHTITVEEGSLLRQLIGASTATVNSWHHQAAKDIGDGLKVTAKTADGTVECIELEGKRYVIGTQFHPEQLYAGGKKQYLAFFTCLFDRAAGYRADRGA